MKSVTTTVTYVRRDIMTINDIVSSPFLSGIVIKALVVGVLVSVCASLLGIILVMKNYAMIGDSLSHVGYFSLALAGTIGIGAEFTTEFSIPVIILASLLILWLESSSKISGDAACAVISTAAIAIGTVLYAVSGTSTSDVCGSLFGSASVITVSDKDVVFSSVLSVIVIVWFFLFNRKIFATSFDESFALATGCSAGRYKLILSVLTSVTIVIGMKMMGAVMISALIVFPALSASALCRSFGKVIVFSVVFSVLSFIAGLAAAIFLSFQIGACVVCVELALMILSFAVKKVKSMIMKREMING